MGVHFGAEHTGVPKHAAERCLSLKLKDVEGIYNKHDYFYERKEALNRLSEYLSTVINGSCYFKIKSALQIAKDLKSKI